MNSTSGHTSTLKRYPTRATLTPTEAVSVKVGMTQNVTAVRNTQRMDHTLELDFDEAFLDSVSGKPFTGVKELIWNSIDADATEIRVSFATNEIDGVTEITVADNGHGFEPEAMGSLYGSTKQKQDFSPGKRRLHGKAGKGRYVIFGVGGIGVWKTVREGADSRTMQEIKYAASTPKKLVFTDPETTHEPVGTLFTFSGVDGIEGVLGEKPFEQICETFAVPIRSHALELHYEDQLVDPEKLVEREEVFDLGEFKAHPASLRLIEWQTLKNKKSLHLCDDADISRHEIESPVSAPSFSYSAFVSWAGMSELDLDNAMAEWDADIAALIEKAKETIGGHFKERLEEKKKQVIEEWRKEGVYPFEVNAAKSKVDQAAQDTFDIVAVTASRVVNETKSMDSRKLSLCLIKAALEYNPGALHRLLKEVINLDEKSINDLSELLDGTKLSSIIATARSVADRLNFAQALRHITSDGSAKKLVNERDHLHKIVAREPWIFGDEYSSCISEKNLTELAKANLATGGYDANALDGPVADHNGNEKRRFDLLLPMSVPQSAKGKRFLVVELKRPSVAIGITEFRQLEDYAHALASDSGFKTTNTKWDFLIAGDAIKSQVQDKRSHSDKPEGWVSDFDDGRVTLWVNTWAEIVEGAEHRLKFMQKQLEYSAGSKEATEYLQRVHSDVIPAALK